MPKISELLPIPTALVNTDLFVIERTSVTETFKATGAELAAFIGAVTGTGNVVGPAASTDNAIARFSLATGKIIKNSTVFIGDTGNITGLGTINGHIIPGGAGTLALLSDLPVVPTTENIEDIVGAMVLGNTETGIAVTYDDTAAKLNFAVVLTPFTTTDLVEGTNLYYTIERVDDRVATLIQNGTGLIWTYDDIANTFTGNVSVTQYTDEMVRDVVGATLVAGTNVTIAVDDIGNIITISATSAGGGGITMEDAQDATGAMVTGNIELGISVTYDDIGNLLNFDAQTAGDLRYALIANGVTGGNTHDHSGGDGAQIAYATLSGLPSIPTQYTDEMARDTLGVALVAAGYITITVNDITDTITIGTSGIAALFKELDDVPPSYIGNGGLFVKVALTENGLVFEPHNIMLYTDEKAQDAVAAMLLSSATIAFTYIDLTPSLTANVIDNSLTFAKLNSTAKQFQFEVLIGNGVDVITTGLKTTGVIRMPRAGTITGWTILSCGAGAPISGSIVIDIWKDLFANYPPTIADTVTGSTLPTVTAAVTASSTVLTGWNTALSTGDVLFFNVNSITSFRAVKLIVDYIAN